MKNAFLITFPFPIQTFRWKRLSIESEMMMGGDEGRGNRKGEKVN